MPDNLIKSISKHECPHCFGALYVESQVIPPTVTSLFTEENVRSAKANCLKRLGEIDIDDEKRDSVKKWVSDPETVFGEEEVENIIASLLTVE